MSDALPAYQPQTFGTLQCLWCFFECSGFNTWLHASLCCACSCSLGLHVSNRTVTFQTGCAGRVCILVYACCSHMCFFLPVCLVLLSSQSLYWFSYSDPIGPGVQFKCQPVADLGLRESISPSGWNLTVVARWACWKHHLLFDILNEDLPFDLKILLKM